MRWSRGGLLFSAVAAVGVSGWVFVASPERVPTHFAFDGTPDEWSTPTEAFVVETCVVAGFTLLFLAVPLLMRVLPDDLINLPHREYWLTPQRRPRALALVARWSDLMGIAANVLLLFVALIVYRTSIRPDHRAPAWWFVVLLASFLGVTALTVVQLYRAPSDRS